MTERAKTTTAEAKQRAGDLAGKIASNVPDNVKDTADKIASKVPDNVKDTAEKVATETKKRPWAAVAVGAAALLFWRMLRRRK